MCNADCLHFILATLPLFLVTGRHQDCIIHSRTQLNSTDHDTRHKWEARSLIIRDCHIYHDGKFDNGHQNDWKGNGFEHDHDDDKYRNDRERIYPNQIGIGDILKILHKRRLADDHSGCIIRFHDLIDLRDLFIYLIRRRLILRTDKSDLIVVALQHTLNITRYHRIRHRRPDQ